MMAIARVVWRLLVARRREKKRAARRPALRILSRAASTTSRGTQGARRRGLGLLLRGNSDTASGYAVVATTGGVVSLVVFAIGYLGARGVIARYSKIKRSRKER